MKKTQERGTQRLISRIVRISIFSQSLVTLCSLCSVAAYLSAPSSMFCENSASWSMSSPLISRLQAVVPFIAAKGKLAAVSLLYVLNA